MKKDGILDYLLIVLGVVYAFILFKFNSNLSLMALVSGIMLFIGGIYLLIKKQSYGLLTLGFGFALTIDNIFYRLHILSIDKCLPFLIACTILFVMVCTFIIDRLSYNNVLKIYTLKVDAEVFDLIKNPNTNKEYYKPVYEYVIGKEKFYVDGVAYINNNIPNLGDKKEIWVDPNDPLSVYFHKSKLDQFKYYFVGISLMLACVFMLITLF